MTLDTTNKKPKCSEEDDYESDLPDADTEQVKESLFEDRKILLNEPITENIMYSVWQPIEQLIKLDSVSPITLYINSCGGDAYASLFISSYLLQSKTPIHTVVTGIAFSGGALISLSGHKRFAYKYSTYMLHLPKSSSDDMTDSKNLISQAKGIEMLDADIFDLLLTQTKMSKKMIRKKLSVDWYLSPSEALKYGIVDTIF